MLLTDTEFNNNSGLLKFIKYTSSLFRSRRTLKVMYYFDLYHIMLQVFLTYKLRGNFCHYTYYYGYLFNIMYNLLLN